MLSLKTHNIMDYIIGALLVAFPWIAQFDTLIPARNVFVILGLGLIGYSLLTNYEFSLLRIIPLRVHMGLDVFSGLFLILAPALFDYKDQLSLPQKSVHYIMGLGAIGLVLMTKIRPGEERQQFQKPAMGTR